MSLLSALWPVLDNGEPLIELLGNILSFERVLQRVEGFELPSLYAAEVDVANLATRGNSGDSPQYTSTNEPKPQQGSRSKDFVSPPRRDRI